MKTKLVILFVYTVFASNLFAQKHDFKWLMGYSFADNPYDTGWGCAIIDFDTPDGNPLFYEEKFKKIDFNRSGSNICNTNGIFMFACNGGYIEGPDDSLMLNGDDLGNEITYPELGVAGSQNILIMLHPHKDNIYYLFNKIDHYFENYGLSSKGVEYSTIDMIQNNGKGKVISRRNSILTDTLDDACLIATKHANGRDWWVVVSEDTKSAYYIFIVDPSGIKLHNYQNFGIPKSRGEAGQSFFSNDGQYFCTATNDGLHHRYNLFFMTFNRCLGQFETFQFKRLNYQLNDWDAGSSFSSDSKKLYYATQDTLFQFPIVSDSLGDLKVAGIYDGFIEPTSGGFRTPTHFGPMQFAPDGKIYLQTTYPTRSLHVIHNPNGDHNTCNFKQHDIYSPTLRTCLPNFPNYRLGPIDGSICDSLGIDNIPWCHWRYNQDSTDYLNFFFTDLSAYEVEEWDWDFGDLASPINKSRAVNPIHRFSAPGVYEVCLIAKNRNGADTLCRTVRIGVVDNKDERTQKIEIHSWPNPFNEFIVVNIVDYNPKDLYIDVADLNGKTIYRSKAMQGSHWIKTENWPPGVIFVRVYERGELIYTEKLVRKN